MIGQPFSWTQAWSLFRDPVTHEKRGLLKERWDALDEESKFPTQGFGQKATGCGATIGIQPKCDFHCTGCYLGEEANAIPALPTAQVLDQIDALRAYLGPKANVQITDGEVTLRPESELIEVLRHARGIGAVPMIMTHGDSLRRRPGLLERLMEQGGLTEISIHIDITQRGRDGILKPKSELELMNLRDEFANLLRTAKKRTGLHIRAAHTLTVTQENLPGIADVTAWVIRNRDAFSLLSYQPLAQVGRTQKNQQGVTPDELWEQISKATARFGALLESSEPLHFGHRECTRFVPFLAVQKGKGEPRLMQVIRDTVEDRAVMEGFFKTGLGGIAFRDDRPLEMVARALGALRIAPGYFFKKGWPWADARLAESMQSSVAKLLMLSLLGRVRVDGVTLTSHHFMSPEELRTDVGQARSAACVFRLPHNGEMVPMCQMNAGGVREQVYAEITEAYRKEMSAARVE